MGGRAGKKHCQAMAEFAWILSITHYSILWEVGELYAVVRTWSLELGKSAYDLGSTTVDL